jgi:acyl-CoA synthetase (AMP-forming)/AMP-acid ligase II
MAIRVETVFAAFEATARAHAAKAFLCDPATWQDLSYGAALERIVAIANRYRAKGCGAGHRVALRMPSGPEMLLNSWR